MKLYIKNMVCTRCKMAVKTLLEKEKIPATSVELGEVDTKVDLSKDQLEKFDVLLKELGFELIDNRRSQTIEKIKKAIIEFVHYTPDSLPVNLSTFITSKIPQDYNYLSNLFSEVEGTTIEKYYIAQRIEKAKELLVYDELPLSEIAFRLGYSSTAYLSNQFKKLTGLTPSYYKSMKDHKRKSIDL
ncbi:MAG TPA: AraC family transcriptional regulator [Chitinophagaceae bacterium]|nr:AraC family transcriptional regulator [Chitinophagaceae bacterium]